uniref:Uncharacterized protein n=1 Tax=mine drainage metagenome TaxID=410659 RepID=E6PUE9_9ZZZZ
MAHTNASKNLSAQHTAVALNDPPADDPQAPSNAVRTARAQAGFVAGQRFTCEHIAQIAQIYIDHLGMCRLEPVTIQAVAASQGFDAIVVDDDGQGYIALVATEQLPTHGTYRLSRRVKQRGMAEELFVVEQSRAGLEQGEVQNNYYVHILRRLSH